MKRAITLRNEDTVVSISPEPPAPPKTITGTGNVAMLVTIQATKTPFTLVGLACRLEGGLSAAFTFQGIRLAPGDSLQATITDLNDFT